MFAVIRELDIMNEELLMWSEAHKAMKFFRSAEFNGILASREKSMKRYLDLLKVCARSYIPTTCNPVLMITQVDAVLQVQRDVTLIKQNIKDIHNGQCGSSSLGVLSRIA